jgi:hypothetical protein
VRLFQRLLLAGKVAKSVQLRLEPSDALERFAHRLDGRDRAGAIALYELGRRKERGGVAVHHAASILD